MKSRSGTLRSRLRSDSRQSNDSGSIKTVMVTAEEHALLALIKWVRFSS